VTGGASGIGADVVRAFAGQRRKVAFVDIQDKADGRRWHAETGATFIPCDITDITALQGRHR
jgi:NAD(P)-dependent dehydrogenase (short-subunit alcohol dehydrogenase family)